MPGLLQRGATVKTRQAENRAVFASAIYLLEEDRQCRRTQLRQAALARCRRAEVLPPAGLPGWDYVLVGRPGTTISRDYADLVADLRSALGRVHGKR